MALMSPEAVSVLCQRLREKMLTRDDECQLLASGAVIAGVSSPLDSRIERVRVSVDEEASQVRILNLLGNPVDRLLDDRRVECSASRYRALVGQVVLPSRVRSMWFCRIYVIIRTSKVDGLSRCETSKQHKVGRACCHHIAVVKQCSYVVAAMERTEDEEK